MDVRRTPDDRFTDLPDFPYEPRYVTVHAAGAGAAHPLRMHYVDEGPRAAPPVLLLHGEPTWSFLHRHMIPPLRDAGLRVVVPDLIGFGRSDKPGAVADHTYARHVAWVWALVEALDLRAITWLGQDWGGLIGLRLLAYHADRFARFVASNTALPSGDQPMPDEWHAFRTAIARAPRLDIARFVQAGTRRRLSDGERAAYDAPFPDERFTAGPRAMPELVPYHPEHPAAEDNRRAWRRLTRLDVPVITAFGDRDPIMAGVDGVMQRAFPGAAGQPHTTIAGAGHFVQEDAGADLAALIVAICSDAG